MRKIKPPQETIGKICGNQKIKDGFVRFSRYVFPVPCDDGMLLYHMMTGELLHLGHEEWIQLSGDTYVWIPAVKDDTHQKTELDTDRKSMSDSNDLFSELTQKWFLIPEAFDEYTHASQILSVVKLLEPKRSEICSFRIFTTTDCNARCFYCYEMGRSRLTMLKQTAYDVAQYIAGIHGNKKVKLSWFGGEPLVNGQAIRIICSEMKRLGIDYYSTMTSNGYLFNENNVREAAEEWKMKSVQITLDGTEDVYNRTKAYVYKDGSAYQRVLKNIELLLDAGIEVSIRLNICQGNIEDMKALADELGSRFTGSRKPAVYVALLREYVNHVDTLSNAEGFAAEMALVKKLEASALYKKQYLPSKLRLSYCMADNDGTVTIMPDGSLGKCEHFYEDHLIGSIYPDKVSIGRDERDAEIAYWKERMDIPECRKCMLFPTCTTLKHCPYTEDGCTEYDRMRQKQQLKARILNEYNRYRA